jgi:predicted metal-dependent phosphoesterase TrpH
MSIDLHIHSTMSDGTMTPAEIVEFAAQKGLKAVSITDHDTIAGVKEALAAGLVCQVEVLSGVELSVKYGEYNVHLLGYMFDPENEMLTLALEKIQEGRRKRNDKIVEKLKKSGIDIDIKVLKEIAGPEQTGRPHFARYLFQKGYAATMDDAFDRYLGQGGQAYVSRLVYDFTDAVDIIHKAKGIAVLAHPVSLAKRTTDFAACIGEMVELGLDGIETYYPTHAKKFKKLLVQLASEKSLLLTGGSDYHGSIRPGTTLAGGKNVYVPYDVLEAMKEKYFSMHVNNPGEI